MNTTSSTLPHVMPHEDSYGYNMSAVCATVIPRGTIVKLLSSGLVAPVAAATDKRVGVVTVGNKAANERVTIITPFRAVVLGKANGTVATGDIVDATGLDGTDNLMDYSTTTTNGNQVGIAIVGGANNTQIKVGIL